MNNWTMKFIEHCLDTSNDIFRALVPCNNTGIFVSAVALKDSSVYVMNGPAYYDTCSFARSDFFTGHPWTKLMLSNVYELVRCNISNTTISEECDSTPKLTMSDEGREQIEYAFCGRYADAATMDVAYAVSAAFSPLAPLVSAAAIGAVTHYCADIFTDWLSGVSQETGS
jgi:hypothetical protein